MSSNDKAAATYGRPPERCGNCGGRGEEFINVDRDVGTCRYCDGTGFEE